MIAVHNGDQEALIQLLFAFKKGITNRLKDNIVVMVTNPAIIDRIISYAAQLSAANLTKETLKAATKSLSKNALPSLNDIYIEIMGICKIASSDYILNASPTYFIH